MRSFLFRTCSHSRTRFASLHKPAAGLRRKDGSASSLRRKHHLGKSPDFPRFSGKHPSGPEKNCEMSDLSRYGDPVLRHERCTRRITHSGSQYLRCSAFNPEAGHKATTGFTPCPPQRRRFCERPERPCPIRSKRHSLQLVSASTMASCSRCHFECFIRERLGEYGCSSNAGRQANMGLGE